MQARIDALCDLAADKTTSPVQLSERIAEEKLDVNEAHSKFMTRPVTFAAQTGSFENVVFFIEDMQADLNFSWEVFRWNLLQWAHDQRADKETRIYLTDVDKKRWLQFKDGTNDIHIFAYLGMRSEVAAILTEDPDKICELARDRYSPLYWACLNDQKPMQEFLAEKLQEYQQRHANDAEKMLTFHTGMLFATSIILAPYAQFDEFLTVIKQICAKDKKRGRQIDKILAAYVHDVEIKLDVTYESMNTTITVGDYSELQTLAKLQTHRHALAVCNQVSQAYAAHTNKSKAKSYKEIDLLMSTMHFFAASSSLYLKLFFFELELTEKNRELLQQYLNASYDAAEQGKILVDKFPKIAVAKQSRLEKDNLIKTLKEFQTSAEVGEKEAGAYNETIVIKPDPVKQLFQIIQKKQKSAAEVEEFIAENNVDITQFYRFRAAIDHAVVYGSTLVAKQLIEHHPNALSIPVGSKRNNLMQKIRQKDISPELKEYILDPNRRLWESFQDGTTDLHAHAFAGRLNDVADILSYAPERLLEINRSGENVFYWAFYSDKSDEFRDELEISSEIFKANLVEDKRWEMLLKLYQSSQKFIKECLTPKEQIEMLEIQVAWFEKFRDNSPTCDELNDFLHIMVAQAYINSSYDDHLMHSIDLMHAQIMVKKLNNLDLAEDMGIEINQGMVENYIAYADKCIRDGDEENQKSSPQLAKYSYKSAELALGHAAKHLEDWQEDIEGKPFVAVSIKNKRTAVAEKIAWTNDFLVYEMDEEAPLTIHQDKSDSDPEEINFDATALVVEAEVTETDAAQDEVSEPKVGQDNKPTTSPLATLSIFSSSPPTVNAGLYNTDEDDEDKKDEVKDDSTPEVTTHTVPTSRPSMATGSRKTC